jgi:transposase
MSDFIWLTDEQMEPTSPYLSVRYGILRVDDRPIISVIKFMFRIDLRVRDAPKTYGRHATITFV